MKIPSTSLNMVVVKINIHAYSSSNSNSIRVGSDKVISWPTPPTTPKPQKLVRHFQATQEADFWYAAYFDPIR